MKIVVADAQDQYWERVPYRSSDHPVARAYAAPKIDYIERVLSLADQRVLDVGCGNGVFTSVLLERGAVVTGVDASAFMLASNPASQLVRGAAERLPFASGVFDVVFEANLLHHVVDPASVVQELSRLSRKFVVLVEPNRLNPAMALFGLVVREERGVLRSSRAALARMLASAGLRVVRCAAMGMITQNNTPGRLVPLLRVFDREFAWGQYVVAVAEKTDGAWQA